MSVELMSGTTVGSPLISMLLIAYVLALPVFGSDALLVPLTLGAIVIVFGVTRITDRIYRENEDLVTRTAETILEDSERGRDWARRKIFAIYAVQVLIVLVVVTTARVATIARLSS